MKILDEELSNKNLLKNKEAILKMNFIAHVIIRIIPEIELNNIFPLKCTKK